MVVVAKYIAIMHDDATQILHLAPAFRLIGWPPERKMTRIEVFTKRGFDDLKLGRYVEITWRKQTVVAYMQDFTLVAFPLPGIALAQLYIGQYRIADRLEGFSDQ